MLYWLGIMSLLILTFAKCTRSRGYLPFSGRILDTMHFLKICFPSPSYQLGMVSSHFGLEHDRPHQADSDALATACALKCLEEIDELPLLTVRG